MISEQNTTMRLQVSSLFRQTQLDESQQLLHMKYEYKFYMTTYKKEIAQKIGGLSELANYSNQLTGWGNDGWRVMEINSVAMDFGIVYAILLEREKSK